MNSVLEKSHCRGQSPQGSLSFYSRAHIRQHLSSQIRGLLGKRPVRAGSGGRICWVLNRDQQGATSPGRKRVRLNEGLWRREEGSFVRSFLVNGQSGPVEPTVLKLQETPPEDKAVVCRSSLRLRKMGAEDIEAGLGTPVLTGMAFFFQC